MDKFTRNLLTEWRKLELPFDDAVIVVGVSGGADSLALLLSLNSLIKLKKLNLTIVAAHFNHGIRGMESDADEEFVRDVAAKLSLRFESALGSIPKKGNLEENSRVARYAYLAEVAEALGSKIILTAHTQNDQAETLLINLIRGSGLDGLSGMRSARKLKNSSNILLVRPLISWAKRCDTELYCESQDIKFRQDSMNFDEKFTRVSIRREIIPKLREINPKIIETLANTAMLLTADDDELSKGVEEFAIGLDQNEFRSLSKSMRPRVLRAWLEKHTGDLRSITSKHLSAIENLILSNKSGRYAEVPRGGKVIKKEGKILFEKTGVEKSSPDN